MTSEGFPNHSSLGNPQESEEASSKVNLKYQTVQINGCRQYGPPRNFTETPPGKESELFVCRIPKSFTEIELLPILERFGIVHQFRLMMDYNSQNRGYGYVLYRTPEQATRALELIPHLITKGGTNLDVKRSYDKCRLFVGNLPRDLDNEIIKNTLKMIYPEMCNFIIHTRPHDEYKNRGFAFIDFPNHQSALRSKKKHGSGTLRLWERVIKVVWAKEERVVDPDVMTSVKTLFIRNIDLGTKSREFESFVCKVTPKELIVKITQIRDFAFVEYTTKSSAMNALATLSQMKFRGHSLSVEWALPPSGSTHDLRKLSDYDSLLKLKCVANGWTMPVYIFGRVMKELSVQYVAVIVRNATVDCTILMEINTVLVPSIHQRAAEVMVKLIERCKGLPTYNIIVKTHGNDLKFIGFVYGSNLNFRVSEIDFVFDLNEIAELMYASLVLCQASPGLLLFSYQQALSYNFPFAYFQAICTPYRVLGCIPLSYRRTAPWKPKGGYPDCTVLLALCDKDSRTNYSYSHPPKRLPMTLMALENPDKWNQYYAVRLSVVKSEFTNNEICFGANICEDFPNYPQ